MYHIQGSYLLKFSMNNDLRIDYVRKKRTTISAIKIIDISLFLFRNFQKAL